MPQKRRTFRVAEKIRNLVANELNRMADPRFELVTVTTAMVSPDLRHAKVYWMVSGGPDRIPEVEEAFASAEGFFRRLLAKELGIRFVPELRFYYDDTLDTCNEVDRLLSRVAQPQEDPGGEEEPQ